MKHRSRSRAASKRAATGSPRASGSAGSLAWAALALVLVTLSAYQPAWHGQPVWDDDAHLTSPSLQSLAGLARIWLEPGATQQYYPLTHSLFWLANRLWGHAPLGYHLLNVLLHSLSALLFWRILRRLGVPGASLAAAVFALHPVHVESVAWISELRNVLSGLCYLLAAWSYLLFDETRRKGHYVLALALFACGLLAKTVVATLPAALLVVIWWRRGRLSLRRDAVPLLPFVAVGLTAGLFTAWMERHYIIGGHAAHFALAPIERVLLAGRAVWFYLAKLFWPADLAFVYPRWEIDPRAWAQYLFPLGALALLAVAWALRYKSRAPLTALLLFVGTLTPALGFFDVYPFRYSYVADHFQYLASLSVIALGVAGAVKLSERWLVGRRPAGRALALGLVVVLSVLTWRQSRTYSDGETLYRATLARNPTCWMALANLGLLRLARGDADEAERLIAESLQLNPRNEVARNSLGFLLARRGRVADAVQQYRQALALWPAYPDAHVNLANALFVQGHLDEAVLQYEEALKLGSNSVEAHNNLAFALLAQGRTDDATPHFEAALRANPDLKTALHGLAHVLATSVNPARRDGRRAVELSLRAVALSGGREPALLDTLAAAYAAAGRFDEAVRTALAARDLAGATGQAALADGIAARLRLYAAGQPFHAAR